MVNGTRFSTGFFVLVLNAGGMDGYEAVSRTKVCDEFWQVRRLQTDVCGKSTGLNFP